MQLLVRIPCLLICDTLLICLASLSALCLRFDFQWVPIQSMLASADFHNMLFISVLYTLLIFAVAKLYSSLWSFAGAEELVRILVAVAVSTAVDALVEKLLFTSLPGGFPLLSGLILLLLTVLFRFSYRSLRSLHRLARDSRARTMVVGAGEMGNILLRELNESAHSFNRVVCLIDDDPAKIGRYMHGVRVVGGRHSIPANAKKYNISEIIFAIPSVSHAVQKEILGICQETDCKLRIVPSIFQLANGEVEVSRLRDVQIEDLLERDSVQVDWNAVTEYVRGKTVLVTGGGGSIGSELCRQVAKYEPRRLIIFDIYENNAYAIQQELLYANPGLNLTVLIGSVRDEARVEDLFDRYAIDIVYHAAAHKHVPLMEDSPIEAVKNNVFGTQNVARAAGKHQAKAFIMISTDKAVNPTNVMGASKRVCEMVVQHEAELYPDTTYAAVRFGNVLGSNGSVIPLFKKQIEAGGPVTVTHKDIIRYFMTIPEAVSLVLQAGALAKGGEIFVLDMGEPVRIDDLARNMIRLSGFTPDVDIPVVYTGLRPGKKLYEELLMAEEGLTKTANDKIFIGHQMPVDDELLLQDLEQLGELTEGEAARVRELFRELVPTYHVGESALKG